MSIKTAKYIRKPFEVEAIRVTEENFEAVAAWCEAKTSTDAERGNRKFIQVQVHHALNDRQTKAFVGDWVLKANSGYKVYTDTAFEKTFDKVAEGNVINNITVIHTDKSPTPQQLADLVAKTNVRV